MKFLVDQIKEQKILEMEVAIDDFIEEKGISERTIIHTMIFDKEVFVDEKEVREYLKDKYVWNPAITDDGKSFVAVLVSSNQVDMDTEIEVELRRGVQALAGELLPMQAFEEVCFNEKGEVNLSSKFETINLSDGLPHIIEIARVAEGEHPAYGKISITQEVLESIETNFSSGVTGVDLAINEDHKKNEAFGWFKDVFLSYDKQTLYGQVIWNSKGTTALSEKEYRYFSPEFRFNYVHPHTGEEHGATLLGGALTNYPFLKMEAITQLNNKNSNSEENVSKDNTTIDLSVHNAKVVELSDKNSKMQVELSAKETENTLLSEKVKTLEATIELNIKKSATEKLFNDGLINAAQKTAMEAGKSMMEVISLSDKMNTKGKGSSENSDDDVNLNDGDKAVADILGLTDEEMKAVEL